MAEKNVVEKFLATYPNKNTQKNYRYIMRDYFKIIKADPDKYFIEKHNYQDDVMKFWLSQQDTAPLSIHSKIGTLRAFFQWHDIEIPRKIWKKISKSLKGSRSITQDRIPTTKELKQILSFSNKMSRALFLISSSSGMRIGEVTQLLPGDIEIDETHDILKINVRHTIAKYSTRRTVYASSESKHAYKQWNDTARTEYLKIAVARSHGIGGKNPNDKRVFPIDKATANKIWNKMLQKAGLDEQDPITKVRKLHIHTLRKYFRTRLGGDVMNRDILELLLGHSGYLDNSYMKYTEDNIEKAYLDAMPELLVYQDMKQKDKIRISNIEKDATVKDNLIAELQKQIEKQNSQIQQLTTEFVLAGIRGSKKD